MSKRIAIGANALTVKALPPSFLYNGITKDYVNPATNDESSFNASAIRTIVSDAFDNIFAIVNSMKVELHPMTTEQQGVPDGSKESVLRSRCVQAQKSRFFS